MRTSILGKVHFVASKYDPETRVKAVRLVLEHRGDYPSEWLAIINLMLTDPTPQRLSGHPQPLGHRRDRRPHDIDWPQVLAERLTTTHGSVCEFIAENKDRFGVAPICRVLSEHGVPIGQRRWRGSLSRTKKDVAALRISMVCSSSALRRRSARISAAASLETPSRSGHRVDSFARVTLDGSLEESRDDLQSFGYDTPVPPIRSDSYTTLLDAT